MGDPAHWCGFPPEVYRLRTSGHDGEAAGGEEHPGVKKEVRGRLREALKNEKKRKSACKELQFLVLL